MVPGEARAGGRSAAGADAPDSFDDFAGEPAAGVPAGELLAAGPGEEELLEGLNPAQREAVTHGEGPLLILAGPGSGKTRVITRRIAWLVSARGVDPRSILAITFTNKAAREMRSRVEALLPLVRGAWLGTFHGTCARILRTDIEALDGYTRDFSIYDTGERNALLARLIKELGLDSTRFRPAMVGGWISRAKNRPEEWEDEAAGSFEGEAFVKLRARYFEEMRACNALDFDDLLLKVLELFDRHPGVRDRYAHRFRHVLVDEYQDTNRVQYLLTAHLASAWGNLAVCGDPDQSIYGWRGADIRNILAFEEDFGARRVVRLEQNYRSKGNILAAASALISHNAGRKAKDLWTEDEDGELLAVLECADEDAEGREIAAQIRGWIARGGKAADCAVFYRTSFQQRALEQALSLARLPYQVVGGLEFFARREIRDLLAWLRLIVNPADDAAFRRASGVHPRGIGETSLARLSGWAADRRTSLARAIASDEAVGAIRGPAKRGLLELRELLETLAPLREAPAAEALERVHASIDVQAWMSRMDEGGGTEEREENVRELLAHAREHDRQHPASGLAGFLEDVALISDVDGMEESADKVALMTLHSAKGLEFPVVFVAGVEDELLPHARSLAESPEAEEEERRLLYVGMTRARERLFLTRARLRRHWDGARITRPSPFLDEIPPRLVEGLVGEPGEAALLGDFEAPSAGPALRLGDRVRHGTFGVGRVERLLGSGINARATVCFIHHGTKDLLLQYAKLERVEGG